MRNGVIGFVLGVVACIAIGGSVVVFGSLTARHSTAATTWQMASFFGPFDERPSGDTSTHIYLDEWLATMPTSCLIEPVVDPGGILRVLYTCP